MLKLLFMLEGNLSPVEKDKIVKDIENEILKNVYIRNIYSRSGTIKGNKRNEAEDVVGSIKIEFTDWKDRPNSKNIINDLKNVTEKFVGIYIEFVEKKGRPTKR